MKKEDIENIFEAIQNEDAETLLKMVNDKKLVEKTLENNFEEDLVKECVNNVLMQIKENGLYEYFESVGLSSSENEYAFVSILSYSKLTLDEVEKYLEKLDYSSQWRILEGNCSAEYIKEYIKKNDTKISMQAKTELIKATKDINYIKSFIEDNDMDMYYKLQLVLATEDREYIKEFSKNKELDFYDKIDLVIATKDKEYINSFIKDDEIPSYQKIDLIKKTKDINYIKECIENNELGISESDRIDLIIATGDKRYIKSLIEGKKLNFDNKMELLVMLRDPEYINECLNNNDLDFSKEQKLQLILATENEDFIKEKLDVKNHNIKSINLPKNMTIGIEIEAEGITKLYGNLFDGWSTTGDSSLQGGIEIVSPVLTSNENDVKNIYRICSMLDKFGCSVSERCGGHIHIGSDFLKSKQAYINLLEIWGNSEELLYTISNEAGEIIREKGIERYAVPISKRLEKVLEKGGINLEDENDLEEFLSDLKMTQVDRYSGINFMNLEKYDKSTIEFRLANGTINPETWIENINLFGGIISSAEKVAEIQEKDLDYRTKEEMLYLDKFNGLKKPNIEEKEKLDLLLSLAVKSEDKSIYERRYIKNNELLEKNPKIKKNIKEQMSMDVLDFKNKGKNKPEVLESAIEATKKNTSMEEIEEQNIVLNTFRTYRTEEYEDR